MGCALRIRIAKIAVPHLRMRKGLSHNIFTMKYFVGKVGKLSVRLLREVFGRIGIVQRPKKAAVLDFLKEVLGANLEAWLRAIALDQGLILIAEGFGTC